MQILKFPSPELFQVCKEVTVFGPELKVLLDSMWDTMVANSGMGLAANQVGLSFRMFVMIGPEGERLYIVNPKIVQKSIVSANLEEGCLSAPGEKLTLEERADWVKVEYQDETGAKHEKVFKRIYSVCVQHETDHLNGKTHLQSESLHKARRKELAKKWGLKIK